MPNTGRALREILGALMNNVIGMLASEDPDNITVAGASLLPWLCCRMLHAVWMVLCLQGAAWETLSRSLASVCCLLLCPRCVRYATHHDFSAVIGFQGCPRSISVQGLKSGSAEKRQGVCLGFSEVIAASTRRQLEDFLGLLIEGVQEALCDDDADVRDAAAKAFSSLQHTVGGRAIDEILPSLLAELTSGNAVRANRATFGLRGILSQKSKDVRSSLLLVDFGCSVMRALCAMPPGVALRCSEADCCTHQALQRSRTRCCGRGHFYHPTHALQHHLACNGQCCGCVCRGFWLPRCKLCC